MNLTDSRYSKYALVREMMDTIDTVKGFDPDQTKQVAEEIKSAGRLMLTGEGSSRIFPAKNAMRKAMTLGLDINIFTDGSRQCAEYNLSDFAVFCASNSGRTKEIVLLAKKLIAQGNSRCYALTANEGTLLEDVCKKAFILKCGWEQAVAATKSVVEQAMFYESILWHITGKGDATAVSGLAAKLEKALTLTIGPALYWSL